MRMNKTGKNPCKRFLENFYDRGGLLREIIRTMTGPKLFWHNNYSY